MVCAEPLHRPARARIVRGTAPSLYATTDSALGPGIPDPPMNVPAELQPNRHELPPYARVGTWPILGGLYYEMNINCRWRFDGIVDAEDTVSCPIGRDLGLGIIERRIVGLDVRCAGER
jgi:hypothetical protein